MFIDELEKIEKGKKKRMEHMKPKKKPSNYIHQSFSIIFFTYQLQKTQKIFFPESEIFIISNIANQCS